MESVGLAQLQDETIGVKLACRGNAESLERIGTRRVDLAEMSCSSFAVERIIHPGG